MWCFPEGWFPLNGRCLCLSKSVKLRVKQTKLTSLLWKGLECSRYEWLLYDVLLLLAGVLLWHTCRCTLAPHPTPSMVKSMKRMSELIRNTVPTPNAYCPVRRHGRNQPNKDITRQLSTWNICRNPSTGTTQQTKMVRSTGTADRWAGVGTKGQGLRNSGVATLDCQLPCVWNQQKMPLKSTIHRTRRQGRKTPLWTAP